MTEGLPWSFGTVLDDLCTHPPGGRGRFTNTELAARVCERGGYITDGYISQLRNGHRDNPTLQTIEDLAAALQVCPAAFVGGRRERRGEECPRRSFPRKLRHLIKMVHPCGRGPYTPEELARAISDDGRYGSISSSYIRELLGPPDGDLPNPRLKHILGLADHFGLADRDGPLAAYFLDDELSSVVEAELADVVALRDAGVVEFVARMVEQTLELSPEQRHQAAEAFMEAIESGEPQWVFPLGGAPSQEDSHKAGDR